MVSVWYGGASWWQRPDGYFTHKRSKRYLHRQVYEDTHGAVPAGHYVHHKDHDPTNNHPDNLKAMLPGHHASHHATGRTHSDEQRAAIRERMLEAWSETEHYEATCAQCGGRFLSRSWGEPRSFCSSPCLERWRCDAFKGEQRDCDECGASYTAVKSGQRFCSKVCNLRHQAKRPPVDHTPKACAHCGAQFTPKRNNARFCQRSCAVSGSRGVRRKVADARASLRSDS